MAGLAPQRLQALRLNVGRLPLFCDTAPAGRIERADAQLIASASQAARRRRADVSGLVNPVAGGVASFAEEGSPFKRSSPRSRAQISQNVQRRGFVVFYTRAVLVKRP